MKPGKRVLSVILIFSVLLSVFNYYTPIVLAEDPGVDPNAIAFEDANFKQALIDSGVDTGGDGEISISEMEALQGINIWYNNISSISGIEYAVNLSSLTIYGCNITDISPIKHLTGLTYLQLSYNKIRDVSNALPSLTSLTTLFIDNNKITDIDSLSTLTALEYLNISNNYITDLSVVQSIPNLYSANLSGNYFDISSGSSDMEIINGLLEYCNVTYSPQYRLITNPNDTISFPDSNLKSALINNSTINANGDAEITKGELGSYRESLSLSGWNISNLSGLEYAINITQLNLSNNRLGDISPLYALSQLNYLYLNGNSITDLTPIAGFTQLNGLNVSSNQIDISDGSAQRTIINTLIANNPSLQNNLTYTPQKKTVQFPGTEIVFADQNLKSRLLSNSSINKNGDSIITRGELAGYSGSLSFPYSGISNLSGLEYAVNIESLYLYNNQISDLSPLSGLTQLIDIYLQNNYISDISPLSGLTELRYLNINNNNISDLSPLTGFTSLYSLDVSRNFLDITAGSAQMTILNTLKQNNQSLNYNLTYSPQKRSVESPGTEIVFADQNLKNKLLSNSTVNTNRDGIITRGELAFYSNPLDLSYSNIGNLSGLEYAVNIETLYLYYNQISDLSPLSGLTQLQYFYLYSNQISDISPLSGLTQLRYLYLKNNNISDLSSLLGYTNLYSLDISSNYLDISTGSTQMTILNTLKQNNYSLNYNLTYSPQKRSVESPGTEIVFTDQNLKNKLLNNSSINTNGDGIITRGELAGYSGSLSLTYSSISNLSGLEYAVNLESLYLYNNQISDISTLAGLTQLRYLNLYDNNISDLSPLTGYKSLYSLDVSRNMLDIKDGSSQMALINTIKQNNLGISLSYSSQKRFVEAPATVIEFEDPQLKLALLAEGADLNCDGSITRAELASPYHWSFNLSNYNITDITPLQYAVNIPRLYLSHNHITDVSPLSSLTQLSSLDLSYNSINDCSPLQNYSNLYYLNLNDNQLSDITALFGDYPASSVKLYVLRNNIPESQLQLFINKFKNVDLCYPQNKLDTTTQDELISFPDIKLLKALIKRGYDKNFDGFISKTEMSYASNLNLSGFGITDITGLEFAVNALNIDLSNNAIENFSPLSNLDAVNNLNIAGNGLTDVSSILFISFGYESILNISGNPLGNTEFQRLYALTNLEELYAARTGITSITGLDSLSNLWKLDISGNSITDFSVLLNFERLGYINLSSNPIDYETDPGFITVREALQNGEENQFLYLDTYLNIPDKNFLSALIRYGYDTNNDGLISDIELSFQYYSLPDLSNCGIVDITGIEHFSPWNPILLSGNFISVITPLFMVYNNTIDLSDNLISDLSPLMGMEDIFKLNLSKNKITDIGPLSAVAFNYDGMLNLSGNQISSIAPIVGKSDIEVLYLANNNITDITGISSFTNLWSLDISGNDIQNPEELLRFFENSQSSSTITSSISTSSVITSSYPTSSNPTSSYPSSSSKSSSNPSTGGSSYPTSPSEPTSSEPTSHQSLTSNYNTVIESTVNVVTYGRLSRLYAYDVPALGSSLVNELRAKGVEVYSGDYKSVSIPDQILSKALLSLFDLNANGTIEEYELADFSTLDLPDSGISNLTGLEKMKNLSYLNLSGNAITDISPLEALPLWYADLSENYIDFSEGTTNFAVFNSLVRKNTSLDVRSQKEGYAPPEQITMDREFLNLAIGKAEKLTADIWPYYSSIDKAVWSSSNPDVVKVDQKGNVFGVKKGSSIITARLGSGVNTSCVVTVFVPVKSISLQSPPDKLRYTINEQLDLSGAMLNVTYEDSTTETLPIIPDMVTFCDMSSPGTKTITVRYCGQTVTFDILVMKPVSAVVLKSTPVKTSYGLGQELDLTGASLSVIYENGTWEELPVTLPMISGYNKDASGIQTVTVTFAGKMATFTVTVEEKPISFIFLKSAPQNNTYYVGSNLNLAGAKLSIVYLNGTWEDIDVTDSMISSFDKNKLGDQTVTVTYSGYHFTFSATGIETPVTDVFILSPPAKTSYIKGQRLDLTGAKLAIIYANGTWRQLDITTDMITGYDPGKIGQQPVSVSYSDKQTTFSVTVRENSVTSIFIKKAPDKVNYQTGEELDLTGAFITALYEDGSWKDLPVSEDMISGYNNAVPAKQTVQVSAEGKTAVFTVTTSGKIKMSPAENSPLKLNRSSGHLSNIYPEMTASQLKLLLNPNGGTLRILDKNNKPVTTGMIGTNCKVELISNNEVVDELKIVLYGDTNGDGLTNTLDLILIKKHLLNNNQLKDSYFEASDPLQSGQISILNLLYIKESLLTNQPVSGNHSIAID